MSRLSSLAVLAVAASLLCQPALAQPTPPDASPPAAPPADAGLTQAVGPLADLAPRDAAAFCPAYASLDSDQKRAFWADFLGALAQAESGQDPTLSRFHALDSDAHRPTFRRGLLQISIESARRADYRCEVEDPKALLDPTANLACGVRILEHWVKADGVIAADPAIGGARGGARYWPSLADPMKRAAIAGRTSASAACAAPAG